MMLITKEMRKKTPPLRSQEGKGDDMIFHFKLFNPQGAGTWYIAEADWDTGEMFGLACIHEAELGYIDLNELKEYRGQLGLPIERDKWFTPTRYGDIKKQL